MAKRVFFSFHYQDVVDFRANVVRQHWLTKPGREEAGFFDHSLWETVKKTGPGSLKKLINDGLTGSSVTCVLIGSHTYARRWVRYEILKSFVRGNKLLGVHINGVKGKDGTIKQQGPNPFDFVGVTYSDNGKTRTLWEWSGVEWVKYVDLGGGVFPTTAPPPYWGNGYKLSTFCKTYDWVGNAGFSNFGEWVG